MKFQDKVVLVTGAAGAIGKGVAQRFCEQGAKVFITDLDQGKIDACCAEFAKAGFTCKGLAADVTNFTQTQAVIEKTKQSFGGNIDVLVNVAGAVAQGPVEDIDDKAWNLMFDVNCKGTFYFIKQVVPLMKAQKFGRIINYSSKSGKTGSALMSHYSAAKAAIIGFTQALAFELADFGITVNCVCPGITDNTGVWTNVSAGYIENMKMERQAIIDKFTAKIPLKRLASIEDVVAVTAFLASSGASYMTGQAINITGGREMH
ncbi:MAG: SDR family oxidoreductase [Phycisphaerae bacterium]|nr:SDR family oxidoreductase [Phycisphaerae bacterium]